MAADQITYADKVGIVPQTVHINQVWDDDMNELKLAINNNADLLDLTVTDTDTNTADIVTLDDGKVDRHYIRSIVADYTAVINDFIQVFTSTTDKTVTLPTAVGMSGRTINIIKVDSDSGNVIIDTTLSQTINGESSVTITKQWANLTFVSNGGHWLIK